VGKELCIFITFLLVIGFVAATGITISECGFNNSVLSCGERTVVSCHVVDDTASIGVNQVQFLMNYSKAPSYGSLLNGTNKDGVWGIDLNSVDLPISSMRLSAVIVSNAQGAMCIASGKPVGPGACTAYGFDAVVSFDCSCSYTVLRSACEVGNRQRTVQVPSEGCTNRQNITTYTSCVYCNPQWELAQFDECKTKTGFAAGSAIASYVALNESCVAETGALRPPTTTAACMVDWWLGRGKTSDAIGRGMIKWAMNDPDEPGSRDNSSDFVPLTNYTLVDERIHMAEPLVADFSVMVGTSDGVQRMSGKTGLLVQTDMPAGFDVYSYDMKQMFAVNTSYITWRGQAAVFGWTAMAGGLAFPSYEIVGRRLFNGENETETFIGPGVAGIMVDEFGSSHFVAFLLRADIETSVKSGEPYWDKIVDHNLGVVSNTGGVTCVGNLCYFQEQNKIWRVDLLRGQEGKVDSFEMSYLGGELDASGTPADEMPVVISSNGSVIYQTGTNPNPSFLPWCWGAYGRSICGISDEDASAVISSCAEPFGVGCQGSVSADFVVAKFGDSSGNVYVAYCPALMKSSVDPAIVCDVQRLPGEYATSVSIRNTTLLVGDPITLYDVSAGAVNQVNSLANPTEVVTKQSVPARVYFSAIAKTGEMQLWQLQVNDIGYVTISMHSMGYQGNVSCIAAPAISDCGGTESGLAVAYYQSSGGGTDLSAPTIDGVIPTDIMLGYAGRIYVDSHNKYAIIQAGPWGEDIVAYNLTTGIEMWRLDGVVGGYFATTYGLIDVDWINRLLWVSYWRYSCGYDCAFFPEVQVYNMTSDFTSLTLIAQRADCDDHNNNPAFFTNALGGDRYMRTGCASPSGNYSDVNPYYGAVKSQYNINNWSKLDTDSVLAPTYGLSVPFASWDRDKDVVVQMSENPLGSGPALISHYNSGVFTFKGEIPKAVVFNDNFDSMRFVSIVDQHDAMKSTVVEVDNFTVRNSTGVCKDFYPVVYNTDSHILGIITLTNHTRGPEWAYCDFRSEEEPSLTSYGTYAPSLSVTNVSNGSGEFYRWAVPTLGKQVDSVISPVEVRSVYAIGKFGYDNVSNGSLPAKTIRYVVDTRSFPPDSIVGGEVGANYVCLERGSLTELNRLNASNAYAGLNVCDSGLSTVRMTNDVVDEVVDSGGAWNWRYGYDHPVDLGLTNREGKLIVANLNNDWAVDYAFIEDGKVSTFLSPLRGPTGISGSLMMGPVICSKGQKNGEIDVSVQGVSGPTPEYIQYTYRLFRENLSVRLPLSTTVPSVPFAQSFVKWFVDAPGEYSANVTITDTLTGVSTSGVCSPIEISSVCTSCQEPCIGVTCGTGGQQCAVKSDCGTDPCMGCNGGYCIRNTLCNGTGGGGGDSGGGGGGGGGGSGCTSNEDCGSACLACMSGVCTNTCAPAGTCTVSVDCGNACYACVQQRCVPDRISPECVGPQPVDCSLGDAGEFNFVDALSNHGWSTSGSLPSMTGTDAFFVSSGTIQHGINCESEFYMVEGNQKVQASTTLTMLIYAESGAGNEVIGGYKIAGGKLYGIGATTVDLGPISIGTYTKVVMYFRDEESTVYFAVDGVEVGSTKYAKGKTGKFTTVKVQFGPCDGSPACSAYVDYIRLGTFTINQQSIWSTTNVSMQLLLRNCKVDAGRTYPTLQEYCAKLRAPTGMCTLRDLQSVVFKNTACYKEAHNFCVYRTFSETGGFATEGPNPVQAESAGLEGTLACSTVLTASATMERIGVPTWRFLFNTIQGNLLMTFVLVLVVVLIVRMRRR
jgi:hypothetical protein